MKDLILLPIFLCILGLILLLVLLSGCSSQPMTDQQRAMLIGVAEGLKDMGHSIDASRTEPQTTTVIGNTVWGAHQGVIIPDGYGGGTFWGH